MPVALIIEIIQAILALAPQVPEVISLGQSAIDIAKSGSVTPEQEAEARSQLAAVRALIDAV